jgi:hypothetical protein
MKPPCQSPLDLFNKVLKPLFFHRKFSDEKGSKSGSLAGLIRWQIKVTVDFLLGQDCIFDPENSSPAQNDRLDFGPQSFLPKTCRDQLLMSFV